VREGASEEAAVRVREEEEGQGLRCWVAVGEGLWRVQLLFITVKKKVRPREK
jgi:hypothetical protein